MDNLLDQFKDAALSPEAQEVIQGSTGKKVLSKRQALEMMLDRIKTLEIVAKKDGNKKKAMLYLRERCKLELMLYKTW